MCSSLNWGCTITSSDCDVRFEWDALRDWVLRSSFPTLLHEVRADIVKHLAKGDDTLYSTSKAIGHPIQSVMKALKVLTERGYVICEYRESKRRRVKANICGLTELGKLAALALLEGVKLEIPIQEDSIYSGLLKVISELWLKNEKLRNVYREALMTVLAVADLERRHKNILRRTDGVPSLTQLIHTASAIAIAAQTKIIVFESFERPPEGVEELVPPLVFKFTIFEVTFHSLGCKLNTLFKCDKEIRGVLLETVREYLKPEILSIFSDYISWIIFLGNMQRNQEKLAKVYKLLKTLVSVNERIYEELGISQNLY